MTTEPTSGAFLQSFSAKVTAVTGIVGAVIAVTVPLTEAVRGVFEMRVNEADHKQQITIEFLKLLTAKDTEEEDRERVLEVLAATTDQPALRDWAQSQMQLFKGQKEARSDLLSQREAANASTDILERDYRLAEIDASSKKREIEEANAHLAPMETVQALLGQLTALQMTAYSKKSNWQQSKAKLTSLTVRITQTTGQSVAVSPATTVPFETARDVTIERVQKLFPQTPAANIQANLPHVLSALASAKLSDRSMVLVALATIRTETASFLPISEGVSRYNTAPGGAPFSLYDPGTAHGKQYGNTQPGDGARFKGRGYVQLAGRENYRWIGQRLGIDLVSDPEQASDPQIAARILALFIKSSEAKLREAIKAGRLVHARSLVDGNTIGADLFVATFQAGEIIL